MINTTGVTNTDPKRREQSSHKPRELSTEDLRFSAKFNATFASTQELSGSKEFIGQERALAALELGLGVLGSGYNIFVSGLTGAEKLQSLRDWIVQPAASARQDRTILRLRTCNHSIRSSANATKNRPENLEKSGEFLHS